MRLTTCRQGWVLLASVALVSGCGSNWRQVAVAPTALASEPTEVRVTGSDGNRFVMTMPRFEGDSLLGEVHGRRRAMATADVRRLALPEASSSRRSAGTATVVSALAVLVAGWVTLVVYAH